MPGYSDIRVVRACALRTRLQLYGAGLPALAYIGGSIFLYIVCRFVLLHTVGPRAAVRCGYNFKSACIFTGYDFIFECDNVFDAFFKRYFVSVLIYQYDAGISLVITRCSYVILIKKAKCRRRKDLMNRACSVE